MGNIFLLWGASAASIPIIIHLLNKQRFKRVVWAAMHWLWASYKKSQKRLQVEQLILLIIRALILVLLSLALARPAMNAGMALLSGTPSTHRVIVLDNSYSMGQLSGGRPIFDKAKEFAAELVSQMGVNDEIDVLFANSTINEHAANSSAAKKNDIVNQIRGAALSDGGTDLPKSIASACGILNERKTRHPRKEIIVITDQTRAGWERPDHQPRRLQSTDADAIKTAFGAQSAHPKILVARLASDRDTDNLAPATIEIDEKVVPVRVETQITGTVRAFTAIPKQNVRVKLKIDGEEVSAETILSVGAAKPETVTFRYSFPEVGSHTVGMEIENDVLPVDNAAYLAVDVEEQMRVLCVDGQQRVGANASEMDFLRQALSPARAEEVKAGKMPLKPDIIADSALPETNLDPYRLVILGNVAMIPREKIQALVQFVKQGGSVIIFVGDRVDPAIYNKDLAELLPMNLGELLGLGEAEGPKDALSEKEMDHPAVAKFKGIKGLPLSTLWTFRRFKLLPKPDQAATDTIRTVLAYENGDVAAVEKKMGDGRVVLFGTTADKAWNNWPSKNHFMPLLNFLALDLIQPAYVQRNRYYGEKFVLQLPRQELGAARHEGIRLTDPAGETSNMEVVTEKSVAESAQIRRAGIFNAVVPGENKRTLYFAANRNTEESDLTTIDDRDILALIPREGEAQPDRPGYFDPSLTQADFQLIAADSKAVEESMKKSGGNFPIARWLAGIMLFLLFVESFLARRFGDFSR